MALIKPKKDNRVEYREKSITLENTLWQELAEYAKVVGIKGRVAEKQNYIISEALKRVFAEDEYIKLRDAADAKAAPKKTTAKK